MENPKEEEEITTPLLNEMPSASSSSEENSPIEQVALTVPTSDDPSIPVLTFRMWVLGTASCALLSFLNQFFRRGASRPSDGVDDH
ncbi:uncharacterized protein A4U43_C08F4190 [Asparagus officinalis]|nr:uncharacterized protein A4U43_C08F4190 [Asparagus officinalis]